MTSFALMKTQIACLNSFLPQIQRTLNNPVWWNSATCLHIFKLYPKIIQALMFLVKSMTIVGQGQWTIIKSFNEAGKLHQRFKPSATWRCWKELFFVPPLILSWCDMNNLRQWTCKTKWTRLQPLNESQPKRQLRKIAKGVTDKFVPCKNGVTDRVQQHWFFFWPGIKACSTELTTCLCGEN